MDPYGTVVARLGDSLATRTVLAMIDALPGTALLIDPSGEIVAANLPAAATLGASTVEEVLGRDVFALLPPDRGAGRRDAVARVTATGQSTRVDDEQDGRTLRATMQPVKDADGRTALVFVTAQDVTDEIRVQSELHVSLEKYRVLFEAFPLGVVITDSSGRILESNRAAEAVLGISSGAIAEQAIDNEWSIVGTDGRPVPPEEYPAARALREHRVVRDQEMGVLRSDGELVWLSLSAAPIPLEGFGVAITFNDITGRRRAEEALRATEIRYRALFDHMAEGIALHRLVRDASGTVVNYVLVDINPQYEAIVGKRRDQVVGRPGTEVYGTSEPPYLAEFSSAPLTGKPLRFETHFQPMDRHFSISVVPLGTEGFATIFFDISALKHSKEEQEKLIALVENSSEFVGLASLDGQVLYVNKTARRLCGIPPEHPVSGMRILDFVPPEARELFHSTILPAVRSGGQWSGEAVLASGRSGAPIPIDLTVFAIPSAETGRPLCLATVIRDTSERVRAHQDRERLEAELRQAQKMESIGRLAGGVAHDFNNLLTGILGNLALVMEDLDPNDPIVPALDDVRRAGESAAALTGQLLAFSRKQVIEPRVLNLGLLIANMERMLRRIIGEDVVLETRTSTSLSNVKVDPGQVEQAIVNLSVNARDAMPSGGRLLIETADVVVDETYCRLHASSTPGRYVRLSVSDTGTGMTPAVKSQAFEPFFTTKTRGTGLGLSMIYGTVTQHGGFLDLRSELGRGTTVEIYLPAVADQPEVQAPVVDGVSPRGEETILLVEDEDLVRDLAERVLGRLGYTVLSYTSAEEALAGTERHEGPVGLLLTDVVLPGMNGRELAAQLQARWPALKVLFSSGYTDDVIVKHGLLEGSLDFIGKPYTPHALAAKVRSVLDG